MGKKISVATSTIFIINFVFGSMAFGYYLKWYDTGQFSSDGLYFMVIGGTIFGGIALLGEGWLYKKYGLWPRDLFLFFLRLIAFSTMYIALNFAASSFLASAIDSLVKGEGMLVVIQTLLILPFFLAFYLAMIIPFGTLVGLANGTLLRISRG